LFGSPNGLCSSITESKHIRAVKEPWRRSNRYHALTQMLKTILRMDRMTGLHWCLEDSGALRGPGPPGLPSRLGNNVPIDLEDLEDDDEAVVPVACRSHIEFSERGYPSRLNALAMYIQQPKFPLVLAQFLYKFSHPDELVAPSTINECPAFEGAIKVHHSAITTFYAPSDLSGSGGL
ncbi:hypothetical protein EDB84DRAFT_1249514, partial [Lactarius hengduanensis]